VNTPGFIASRITNDDEESEAQKQRATRSTVLNRMSVVIINFNYATYLEQCVTSVLTQDIADIEIIVIDDGSSDSSLQVLKSITDTRLRYVTQSNAGMISAMNRGFAEATAPFVVFLDADDYLLPGALRSHLDTLALPGVVRSQGYMDIAQDDAPTGARIPGRPAPDGDLRQVVLDVGPGAVVSTPNSGNAWSRPFLAEVFPLPLGPRGLGAETFLMDAAPLYGLVVTMNRSVATYRIHGKSMSDGKKTMSREILARAVDGYTIRAAHLASLARKQGHSADATRWVSKNWRVLTLRDLLNRSTDSPTSRPLFAAHLKSSLRVSGGWHKKAAVATFIAGMRLLPTKAALTLAKYFIRPHNM
jgi:glycosyltransferase involved in cell wall biosynthesis